MQARSLEHCFLKEKRVNSEFSNRNSLQIEDNIDSFSEKQKLEEFDPNRTVQAQEAVR